MEGRNWLGFGQRAPRTSQVTRAPTPNLMTTQSDLGAGPAPVPEERSLPRSATQIHIPSSAQKSARLSRISSYIGLGPLAKAHAATATEQNRGRTDSHSSRSTEGGPRDQTSDVWKVQPNTDAGYVFKPTDQTWHNPNLTQMMDTVSSAILSRGVSEPIPRHLNSFVIGMIEEFRIRLGRLNGLESQVKNLHDTREKEIQEFAAMADEWRHHEDGYKAEVKRLEQIIAARDGMHSVVAARAGSVFNRRDSRAFQAKLDRLSESEDREIVLDHGFDDLTGMLYASRAVMQRHNSSDSVEERMAAAQQFLDHTGRPPLPSPQSSSAAPSSASSSVNSQGVLTLDHLTPHTSPPHPGPVHPCINSCGHPDNGSRPVTMKAVVGLDGDNGDNANRDYFDRNGSQRSDLAPSQTAPSQTLRGDQRSKEGTSQSSRSATLMAMSHNCVAHVGQPGGSDCPRNRPITTAQSGADPFPDGPTKQRFRSERTVLNANMRQRSYMTNQELRDVLDDRNYRNKQVSRGAPVELQYVGDVTDTADEAWHQ